MFIRKDDMVEEASLEEIVCKASGGLLNNAGQILNHELYFVQFRGAQATRADAVRGCADDLCGCECAGKGLRFYA